MSVINRDNRYVCQGRYNDCAVVALKNVYAHFGVNRPFLIRDTLKDYIIGSGGSEDELFNRFHIEYKTLYRNKVSIKNIERVISNGLSNGKIYSVTQHDKYGDANHVYLLTNLIKRNIVSSPAAKGDGFVMLQKIDEKKFFLAVNRRNSGHSCYRIGNWTPYSKEGKVYYDGSSLEDFEYCNHIEYITANKVAADLCFFHEGSFRWQNLLEISGIKKTSTKKECGIYTDNVRLMEILYQYRIGNKWVLHWYLSLQEVSRDNRFGDECYDLGRLGSFKRILLERMPQENPKFYKEFYWEMLFLLGEEFPTKYLPPPSKEYDPPMIREAGLPMVREPAGLPLVIENNNARRWGN